jgi:hypothetical protein
LNTLLSPVAVEEESLHLVVVVLVVIAQASLVNLLVADRVQNQQQV